MSINHPKYFSFKELTATSTGLDNTPGSWDVLYNLRLLAWFLDEVRVAFGKPIRVNCAFRSTQVNSKVGGVATSGHLKGVAADICAWSGKECDNRELISVLEKKIGIIDQLISYHAVAGDSAARVRFIHVSIDQELLRGQRLYK